MGYIHRAVVGHIKDNYHVSTEVPLTTFGRADILQNRAIWEVKHSGKNPLARTSEALAQSFTYILLNEEVGSLGQADAFSGEFYIGCEGYSYQVKYYTPLPGVVLYSVSEVSNYTGAYYRVYVPESLSEKEKQTNSALGIGAAGAGVGFAMSYGCPSSCFSGGGMTSVFPNRANCFN